MSQFKIFIFWVSFCYTVLLFSLKRGYAQSYQKDSFNVTYFFSDSYHEKKIRKKPSLYSTMQQKFKGSWQLLPDSTVEAMVTLTHSVYHIRDEYIRVGSDGFYKLKFDSENPKHGNSKFGQYIMRVINRPYRILLNFRGGILNENTLHEGSPYFDDTLTRDFKGSEMVQATIKSTKAILAVIVGKMVMIKYLKEVKVLDTVALNKRNFTPQFDTVVQYIGRPNLFSKRQLIEEKVSARNVMEIQIDTIVVVNRSSDSLLLNYAKKVFFKTDLTLMGDKSTMTIEKKENGNFKTDLNNNLGWYQNEKTQIVAMDSEKAIGLEKETAVIEWFYRN